MSDQEKHEILTLIEAGKALDKRWNIYKILTVILAFTTTIIFIGIDIGNWQAWKSATERRVTNLEAFKETVQNAKNEQRAAYNSSIKIK